ncbi:hypothetical protein D3C73_831230 [compost metagenome]
MIVDPRFLVGLDRIARTDFFHPVLEVVGRLISAASGLHLHLQHGAQLGHRVHAGDTQLAHPCQQLREPTRHVGGLKAARLTLKRDRLKGFLHVCRVGDLGVLPQGIDHARRFAAVRALADRKLGRRRCVGQGLVQLHAGTYQGVDHLGHLIARHARFA